jgi:uncharacterized protein
MTSKAAMKRRDVLLGGAGLAGLSLMTGRTTASIFQLFMSRPAHAASLNEGLLVPIADEMTGLPLLRLPEGFCYVSYGWTGDMMCDGIATPGNHDGMGVVHETASELVLVRNHEQISVAPSFARPKLTYDPISNGGTTNLIFDLDAGNFTSSRASLSGTVRNCAGGPTPWRSWLTCEETTAGEPQYSLDHGWIFEVPKSGNTDPVPLKDMGRFTHEAVAVDPATGYVYETEDRNPSGFYRFVAAEWGNLRAGGLLQMMKIRNATSITDLRGNGTATGGIQNGETYDVEWVDITDAGRAHTPGTTDGGGVVTQGMDQCAAIFTRLEGIWYDSGSMFFTSTNGGPAGQGQIWQYTPAEETLTLIYVSPDATVLNAPDNITVHPNRGIILCEDGAAGPHKDGQRLHFLTCDGRIFPFAENNIDFREVTYKNFPKADFRDREWCGACFSPDGEWLFVNIMTPGVTFAITGPWNDYGASNT